MGMYWEAVAIVDYHRMRDAAMAKIKDQSKSEGQTGELYYWMHVTLINYQGMGEQAMGTLINNEPVTKENLPAKIFYWYATAYLNWNNMRDMAMSNLKEAHPFLYYCIAAMFDYQHMGSASFSTLKKMTEKHEGDFYWYVVALTNHQN